MKRRLVNAAKAALDKVGIAAVRTEHLESLARKANAFEAWDPLRDSKLLSRLTAPQAAACLQVVKQSRAQLRQDLFVLAELDFKKNGFFVEFGATNGVDLSNTYLLEKEFQWRGILAEPARCWHRALRKNRSAAIDTRCVWSVSKAVLRFNEVPLAELSTVDSLSSADLHRDRRKFGRKYDVETISLNDLLEAHDAPRAIDYLSIDTEGSELEILGGFDFDRHTFAIITCEHNYTAQRDAIRSLLMQHGYVAKHQDLSEFEDWYVRAE
jgi:FkbM family methyltransferase